MTTFARRARGALLLLAVLAGPLAAFSASASAQQADELRIGVVEIKGTSLDDAYAGYIADEVTNAPEHDLDAVVLQLESPGAIKSDVRRLVRAICEAPVPVAVWVGPFDAGVQGAATLVWMAADVGLVSPDATVGSANPLGPAGNGDDEPAVPDCARPAFKDAAAADPVVRALATRGGRVPAAQLVEGGFAQRAGTIAEAIKALEGVPGANGQPLRIGDGSQLTTRHSNPGLITRVRGALGTIPTLVYLLLLSGIAAIVFEAFQPGFGPAGYAGAGTTALAIYGLTALPIRPLMLLLVLGGTAAMALDLRRNALGPVTWGGAVALTIGSRWLFHSDGSALLVPWPAVAFGVLGSLVFYVVAMTVVLRALRGQSAEMGTALLGRVGEVRSTLNPQGHVLVEGALWRARAIEWDGPVPAGTKVTVTAVDSEALVLDVQPVEQAATR